MSLGGNPFASWSGVLHNESKAFLYEDDVLFNKDKTILIAYRSKETSYIIPKTVRSIGIAAFGCCSSLTSIDIPDSVTRIENGAFYGCSSFISVNIPDSVTSIGSYTFYVCSSLTNIHIPDSVTSIGYGAFGYCEKLSPQIKSDIIQRFGKEVFDR